MTLFGIYGEMLGICLTPLEKLIEKLGICVTFRNKLGICVTLRVITFCEKLGICVTLFGTIIMVKC